MKRPILIILLFYLFGILLFEIFYFDLPLFFVLIIIFGFIVKENSVKYSMIFIFVTVLGYLITGIHSKSENFFEKKYKKIEVKIYHKKVFLRFNRYFVKVRSIDGEKMSFNSVLNTKKDFEIDDVLEIDGAFKKVFGVQNFKVFNYRNYLKSKDIFNELDAKKISKLGSEKEIKNKIYSAFLKSLEKGGSKGKEFLKAIILNDSNSELDYESFRSVGLAHILAISGLHINVLITFLEKIGENIRVKKKYFSILLIIFLFSYGYLVGFPVSILRALVSYLLQYVIIYKNKIYDKINVFVLTAFIVLIINPYYIYSPGFYFSFASIFGINYVYTKLKTRFLNTNKQLLLLFSIQISVLPIQIYYYNEINLVSFIANIVIVPFIEIYLILGMISLGVVNVFITSILDGIYTFIITTTAILKNIEIFRLFFRSPNISEIVLYYLLLVLVLEYKKIIRFVKNNMRRTLQFIAVLLLMIFFDFFNPKVYINFVDIGQGDGILLRSNGKSVMIDTGGNPLNFNDSGKKLKEYLLKNGIYSLDSVFVSHGDLDHMGNLIYLQDNFQIGRIYYNQDDKRIKRKEKLKKHNIYESENILLEVIEDGEKGQTSNDSSMVLKGEFFGKIFLFTGDIEKGEDDIILNEKIDFLKVAHHGSKHSTRDIFLDNNEIDNAVISVGKNRYGHPTKEVLERLKNRRIKIYRTDIDGNTEVIISRFGFAVNRYNEKIKIGDLIKKLIYFGI